MKRPALIIVAGALAALAAMLIAFVLWVPLASFERLSGTYAPVFDPGGRHVYYIRRDTFGVTWGLGFEFFSPPAYAYAVRDRFSLSRLDRESGETTRLADWPNSPVEGRVLRNYRGRIFEIPSARLRFEEADSLDIRVRLSVTEQPTSILYGLHTTWPVSEGGVAWREGHIAVSGDNQSPLAGAQEVIALPGREGYPSAIVEYDHARETYRILVRNRDFDDLYGDGVAHELLQQLSRRAAIERIAALKRTKAEIETRLRAAGLSEAEVFAQTTKEMRRLGFYPPVTTLTAQPMTPAEAAATDLPILVVAEAEMASGIFPDIERAIAEPGRPVDKAMGRYVIHSDFDNSKRLNDLIGAGARAFVVRFKDRFFRLSIIPPRLGTAGNDDADGPSSSSDQFD